MDRAITCQPHIFTLITWGWCTLVTRGKLACPIKINPIWTSGRQGWQTCLPGASEASRDFSKFQNLELLNQVFLCNGNVLFLFPNHSPKKILVVSNCFASPILNHLFRIPLDYPPPLTPIAHVLFMTTPLRRERNWMRKFETFSRIRKRLVTIWVLLDQFCCLCFTGATKTKHK